MKQWASVPLRIGLGVIFIAHGLQKVFGIFSGTGIQGFSKMLSGLGFVPSIFWAYLVAYIELIGGILLILGIFTRLISVTFFIIMLTTIFKVHLGKGFFISSGGYEYSLFIALVCIALIILGGGKLNISERL